MVGIINPTLSKPVTKTRRPLRIFIYHAQGDSEIINALANLLFLHGVEVTLPEEADAAIQLEEGEQAIADKEAEQLQKLIHDADLILFCLSNRFNQQVFMHNKEWAWVLEEILKRRQGDLFVIPVSLHDCDIPERLRRWPPVNLYKKTGMKN